MRLRGHAPVIQCLSAAAIACAVGCTTQYQPRTSPRISVILSGGMPAYARDGRVFEHGVTGGGLVDAVSPDPEARDAAETYHNRLIGGFVSEVIGVVCLGAGVGTASIQASQQRSVDSSAGALLACALVGTVLGGVLTLTAQPYQWDAINIYNDHVDARTMPYWSAPPGMFPPRPAFQQPPNAAPPGPVPSPAPTIAPSAPPVSSPSPASAAPSVSSAAPGTFPPAPERPVPQ